MRMATPAELEEKMMAIVSDLASELISLTPEFMKVIEFEIVSTDDGGADIGLMETHPEVKNVSLSREVYHLCSDYLPLVKRYATGWKRSLFTLKEEEGSWNISINLEYR